MLSINATFIFVLLSFIIFVFLMNLICYKPIMKVILEREKFYEKNRKTVDETKGKTEEIIKEADNEIRNAKFESANILKNTNDENAKTKEEAIKNKKNDMKSKITSFENTLSASSTLVKEKMRNEIEGYVKKAVSKILDMDENSINVDTSKINEILK